MKKNKPWEDTYHVYVHIGGEDWDYLGGQNSKEEAEKIVQENLKVGQVKVRIESDADWKMESIPKIKISKKGK